MKIVTDEKKIDDLLSRSVADIIPSPEDLKERLMTGKRMSVYIGMDPTYTALHLGHSTNIIWLEKFRQLGHQVTFLVGDFTARIGDPTDEAATRTQLSRKDVEKNMKKWVEMIRPLIDIDNKDNPVKIVYNHDWLSKMTFEDVIDLSSHFTVQQMLERDMFEERMKNDKPIFVHEFFYPLMQGYDSVVLDVDIELCGTDQLFNAMTGRHLMKKLKNKEKFVITTNLLENPKTGEKMMSKSRGTGVYLDESPKEMFGKIMSQADENIYQLFIDCTLMDLTEIDKIKAEMDSGKMNPRDAKIKLAKEIIKIYHDEAAADKAETNFIKVFSQGDVPEDMLEVEVKSDKVNLVDLLVDNKVVSSKSEVKRLMQQGAVKVNDEKFTDFNEKLEVADEVVVRVGKLRFVRLKRK